MKNIFLILSSVIILTACHQKTNEVVVYTSVDQIFSEPVLQDFEKQSGIKVKAVFDTEETKSTGVLNRLIAERNYPQADVFWSGDPIRSIVLKDKGITAVYHSPEANDIPAVFKDPEGYWTGFSARARVLIYNKKHLKPEQVPQSIFDLTKPEYKGQVAIANPLFGTTTFHIAALFTALGDQKAKEFLSGLKHNQVVIATSNGDVKDRVSKGQLACGLTDTDDAFEAMKENPDVGMVFLDQKGKQALGTLIMPNTLCLIKNSPNTENGKKLIDFLLQKSTEAKLAKLCAQMPLHKSVPTPKDIPSLDDIIPMHIDYDQTAQKLLNIQNYLKEWIDN